MFDIPSWLQLAVDVIAMLVIPFALFQVRMWNSIQALQLKACAEREDTERRLENLRAVPERLAKIEALLELLVRHAGFEK